MPCAPTTTSGELGFIHALMQRPPVIGGCAGPMLHIALWPYRVFVLEHVFDSPAASDLLWEGFTEDNGMGVHFKLCAAHWMDLAALHQLRAAQYRRNDWSAAADQLLSEICKTAGWDVKEIINMITWQRKRLT